MTHTPNKISCPPRRGALRRAQRGFTALELIVVLIVGLGVIAVVASKFDMLFGGSNVNEEVSDIGTLLANTKGLKTVSGYGVSGTNLIPQLIAAGGIPKNMSIVSGVLYNTWGGTVAVTSTGPGFSIGYTGTPEEACVKLSTKANKGGTFASVKVNSAASVSGEYTSAQATTDCSSPTANSITWTSAN